MRKEIEKLLNSGLTAYQIAKRIGVQPVQIQRYMNGETALGNMTLERAEQLYNVYLELQEENKMKEQISKLIEDLLNDDRENDNLYTEGSYDVYFEPNFNSVWIADRGMAYGGDDKESYEVAIIDDGELDIRI